MTLEVKDIIYLLVYIISIASIYLANQYSTKNRFANIEKELRRGMKVLYQDAGQLNLIDCDTCKRYRDEIFTALRRSEKAQEMFLIELREIKEGIIKLNILVEMLKQDGIKKD